MRILLTGGGTGGHFYPLIAVAEEIRNLASEKALALPEFYYVATEPYNLALLYEYNIKYKEIKTGKLRRNLSARNIFKNLIDIFRTTFATIRAIGIVYKIYPDVVFGKGGYSSFPTLFAAIILRVPVIIHESDSIPGRVNAFIGKFADKIALSYPEASTYFNENKVAWTGNPIRSEVMEPKIDGAREKFGLTDYAPTVLILGGSQGAQNINDAVVDALPFLVEFCQILHQTGEKNYDGTAGRARVALRDSQFKNRYRPFPYFNEEEMQLAYGVSDLIISRAGSTIFEIAAAGKPAILIPIKETVSHNQRHNAFSYAKMGGALVIEENNLQPEILQAEIHKVINDQKIQETMKNAAKAFARKDAAKIIAEAILDIGLSHEK